MGEASTEVPNYNKKVTWRADQMGITNQVFDHQLTNANDRTQLKIISTVNNYVVIGDFRWWH